MIHKHIVKLWMQQKWDLSMGAVAIQELCEGERTHRGLLHTFDAKLLQSAQQVR
jgi:hypothetical protein